MFVLTLKKIKVVCFIVFSISLVACGGGGGGSDDGGSSSSSSSSSSSGSSTQNLPLVANAGIDMTVEEGVVVRLTASAIGIDGGVIQNRWRQVGGPGVPLTALDADGNGIEFTAPDTGTASSIVLILELTITNADGASDSDQKEITVTRVNDAPTANAGSDQSVVGLAEANLAGSGSDIDGTIASYLWEQTSGVEVDITNADQATASFTAPSTNTEIQLVFTLTVTDSDGATAEDSVEFTITPENAPIALQCGDGEAPTGTVNAVLKSLTRTTGVSPEAIYFSAQESTDEDCQDLSGGSDQRACQTGQWLGYHFEFDDPDSGVFTTTGNSKTRQVGGSPRAVHTFVCEGADNSRYNEANERCEYAVRVRVENPNGDFHDACLQVNVLPQDKVYASEDTYCVSSEGNYDGCPDGATELDDSPDIGDYSGSRVLFQRGSSGIYSNVCIGYDERNVRVGTYGQGDDPVIGEVNVGVVDDCNQTQPSTQEARSYPTPQKDADGHVTSGWAFDIGVSDLRAGHIKTGMSATLVTYHNIDMDWSAGGEFDGSFNFASNGWFCTRNDSLDCDAVPYPYGVFASEVRAYANPSNLPQVNFLCVSDCGVVNSAMVGVEAQTANEHNARFMGTWGMLVSNSWLRGNHIGGAGPKHKVTLRQFQAGGQTSQTADPENFEDGSHDGNRPGWVRGATIETQFTSHYSFVVDNLLGDEDQMDSTDEAGFVHLESGTQYSGVFGSRFLTHPGAESNPTQLFLGGKNIVADEIEYNGFNTTCRFDIHNDHPEGSYFFEEDLIFVSAPDDGCDSNGDLDLPLPGAPVGAN